MSKPVSSLARHILHMTALNNIKIDKGNGTLVTPVVYDYYTRKCSGKKSQWQWRLSYISSVTSSLPCFEITNLLRSSLRKNTAGALLRSIQTGDKEGRMINTVFWIFSFWPLLCWRNGLLGLSFYSIVINWTFFISTSTSLSWTWYILSTNNNFRNISPLC